VLVKLIIQEKEKEKEKTPGSETTKSPVFR
jgi:hypothetical protein